MASFSAGGSSSGVAELMGSSLPLVSLCASSGRSEDAAICLADTTMVINLVLLSMTPPEEESFVRQAGVSSLLSHGVQWLFNNERTLLGLHGDYSYALWTSTACLMAALVARLHTLKAADDFVIQGDLFTVVARWYCAKRAPKEICRQVGARTALLAMVAVSPALLRACLHLKRLLDDKGKHKPSAYAASPMEIRVHLLDQEKDEATCCWWCGKEDSHMSRCSTCAKAVYCNRSCQHAHWGRHKGDCCS